jgi:integrase
MEMSRDTSRVRLTVSRVEAFNCPKEKSQAFLWDTEAPSLMLRATPTGRKTYAFEARLNGTTVRIGIGTAADWSLDAARKRAAELKQLVDRGEDPRELEKAKAVLRAEQQAAKAAQTLTVGDLWPEYLETGKPKRRDAWKPRYLEDLIRMSSAGGEPKKRGEGTTRPGPIYPLLSLALVEISEDTLKDWQDRGARISKHQAARALMMFRGFLRWSATKPKYRALVDKEAGRAPALLEGLPSMKRRTDSLEFAQVAGWWAGVEQLSNRAASVYLRALLLTGARREELAGLKWQDVDFQWRKLTIADKVEDTRTIPLTPYLAQLLATLPRRNEWVFASTRELRQDDKNVKRRERDAHQAGRKASTEHVTTLGETGRMTDPRHQHARALTAANIESLTLHGLRRSFSLLGEAAGAPAGAIAQVMGHKPSATAEGYRERSVDALRPYLALIEAHILTLAGVQFDADAEPGKLVAVKAVRQQVNI